MGDHNDHTYVLPALSEECSTTNETLSFNSRNSFVSYEYEDISDFDDSDKDPDYVPLNNILNQLSPTSEELVEPVNFGEENVYPSAVDINIKKRKMTHNEKYESMMKIKEIKKQKQVNKHPIIKKSCTDKCRHQCDLLSDEHQTTIWSTFWNLHYTDQRKYLSKCVTITPVKRRRDSANNDYGYRKNQSRIYTLTHPDFNVEIVVCKSTLLQTLGYTNDSILTELVGVMKKDLCGKYVKENRGRPRKDVIDREVLIKHIKSFNPCISHYRRHNSPNLQYLPRELSIKTITEVGHLNSSTYLDCGMAIEFATNRPILKIFNHNGSTVEEEDITRKDSGKKYLVMRNKRTNEVSIYGTRETYLKKPDYLKMKTIEVQSWDKEDEFASVFGTKKASQISKSRKNESIVSSTDIIENITTSSSMLDSSLYSQTSELLMYLPIGCNRFSNKVENIYPLSTLLYDDEIDGMTDYAKEVISMLPMCSENEDFSEFFITNINRLTHKTIQNICLLTFADGLVELLKRRTGDVSYRDSLIYANSEEINNKLLDNFLEYSITGRDFTSKMKDKAVCHLIIIMLSINMNVIDLTLVSPFLPSSSQKRLVLLMRLVGATALKDDKTKYTLKIPLASLPSFNKQPKRSR